MNINRIDDIRPTANDTLVDVKEMGNIIELRYMSSPLKDCPIQKISSECYVDKKTGEIKRFKHLQNRLNDKASISQSLKRLRDLINTNLTNPDTALWITLTYKENMTDTVRLYNDYRRFWQRFCYYLKKRGYPKAEYIAAAEPQARGAWHLHCLFIFPKKAPFIPNDDIEKVWGQGFTKTKGLKDIDNPGLYLTAYLGDMELTEALSSGITKARAITEVSAEDERGNKRKKAIIKGARLSLYPAGFNLYRCSRGIKRPIVYKTTEGEAQKTIGSAPKTYEKTIAVTDESGDVKNIINYRQYNKAKR